MVHKIPAQRLLVSQPNTRGLGLLSPPSATSTVPKVNDKVVTTTRCKVLIVDDDQALAESIETVLEERGNGNYETVKAYNAQEAITKFKEGGFSIVITDLQMPGMQGDELSGILKQIEPSVSIILITGNINEIREQYLPNLFTMLVKPLEDHIQLMRFLKTALAMKS